MGMRAVKAELRPAYVWLCDACGEENFERAVVYEFAPEESEALKEQHGLEPDERGNWVSIPDKVTCLSCAEEFETQDMRDPENKDYGD